MTDRSVADETLGKINRKYGELLRRLLVKTKPLNPERVLRIMQIAIEGTPKPKSYGSTHGKYLLECCWAYDNHHTECATISLENCDISGNIIPFEELLNPDTMESSRQATLEILTKIFQAQIPSHGSYQMKRLYRVSRTFNDTDSTIRGSVPPVVDFHFVAIPICDFDKNNQPVPCKIER